MLRKTRTILAIVFFTLITLLFLDFTGTLHVYLGWMAKIQFLPAVMALNVVVIVALVSLTLIFGRIYCSVICPLGIMQDIIAKVFNHKKNSYSYSPAKNILRFIILGIFFMSMISGLASFAILLAPYSSYGRIAQNLLQPIYIGINNLAAMVAEHYESYAFYEREIWIRSTPTFIIATVSLIAIGYLAWKSGRTYCNTICPVGTILGQLARLSILKIKIDADKCKNCHKCERNCKASCIDIKNHMVDYSRCVTCGNCLSECKFDSIHYQRVPISLKLKRTAKKTEKKEVNGRREFLIGTGIALASATLAQEKKKVDGGLAIIEDKVQPKRNTPITPPGSLSASNMAKRCTGCQLCVSECPNDVLRPSTDMKTLMQPVMSYERGYCRPECNRCSTVCPTGAIQPITLAQKSSTQIGHAVWVRKNCIAVTDNQECGNCERHCPTGAIQMVFLDDDDNKPLIPAIDTERCIGCGACENLCPARPFSAIYVEGHEVHKEN